MFAEVLHKILPSQPIRRLCHAPQRPALVPPLPADSAANHARRFCHPRHPLGGYNPADHHGALVPPVYTSATFAFPNVEYGMRCFSGEEQGYFYAALPTPRLALLESRLTSLEQGAGAVVFGSGMGAITATLWSLLQPVMKSG